MENTKRLTTTAMMVALSVTLALALYFLPLIQGLIFLVSIPLTLVGIKYNYKYQGLAFIALFLILLMIDPIYAFSTLFIILPLSFAQSYGINHKKEHSFIIVLSSLGIFFGLISLLWLVQIIFDINVIKELMTTFDVVLEEMKSIYIEGGILNPEEQTLYLDSIEQVKNTFKIMMPSFLMMYSFINGLLAFMVTKAVMKPMNMKIEKSYFKDFRINKEKRNIILIILVVVTLGAILDNSNGEVYLLNFSSILTLIFQINALAFIWFKTEKHSNRKALRILIVIAFIVSGFIGVIGSFLRYGLAILGFLDMYFDFRNRGHKNSL
jgi:uncharacterized protein YybS (DUF2232 family)